MTDLMQRLRAADPITDDGSPPPVETLLTRLDEVDEHHPAARRSRPRPQVRRRRRLVPAIAALAIVATVVGLQQRSMSPNVVAEAREALGAPGEIIHVVTRLDYTVEGAERPDNVVLQDEEGRPLGHFSPRTERWTALDPLRERSRFTLVPQDGGTPHTIDYTFADGITQIKQSWSDELQTEKLSQAEYDSVRGELSPGQPGPDPVAGVRKLLADGELKAAGEETLEGRRVLRLTGEEPSPNGSTERPVPPRRIEYLVDAETFAPVRITYADVIVDGGELNALRRVITFEVFERLPLTPENEALLRQPSR